jgi:hypothetical protein
VKGFGLRSGRSRKKRNQNKMTTVFSASLCSDYPCRPSSRSMRCSCAEAILARSPMSSACPRRIRSCSFTDWARLCTSAVSSCRLSAKAPCFSVSRSNRSSVVILIFYFFSLREKQAPQSASVCDRISRHDNYLSNICTHWSKSSLVIVCKSALRAHPSRAAAHLFN